MQQSDVSPLRRAEEILMSARRLAGMTKNSVYDEASEVDAEDGLVIVKGPDEIDVRLTPGAAEETSDRLLAGALKARGQRYFEDDDR